MTFRVCLPPPQAGAAPEVMPLGSYLLRGLTQSLAGQGREECPTVPPPPRLGCQRCRWVSVGLPRSC